MKCLLALATLLIFTACAAPVTAVPTVAPSHTPPPTNTSTATPTATITPSLTITPTATEIQPTPDFLQLPFANNILFAPAADPDCQLPCWQGLRVGESDRDDIQRIFDEVFGFNGTIDFFDPPGWLFAPIWIVEAPGTYTTGYAWYLDSEGTTGFSIQLAVDESTGFLQGIQFHNVPGSYYTVHNPQQIIRELGTPDYIFAEARIQQEALAIIIRLKMTYKNGINFEGGYVLLPIDNDSDRFERFCLDDAPNAVTAYHIVAPFDRWNKGTAVQEEWVFDQPFLKPLDEVLDLTIEEFAEIALQDDPCIEINQDLLLDQ